MKKILVIPVLGLLLGVGALQIKVIGIYNKLMSDEKTEARWSERASIEKSYSKDSLSMDY